MDHSYEEIRIAAIEIITGRERCGYEPSQYENLKAGLQELFQRRDGSGLSRQDREIYLEVFWDLFRQGIITLGLNDSNNQFPWFRLTESGRRIIENQDLYFFHDVSSYEKVIMDNIPNIDTVTLIYMKEAMQSFYSGCLLSSTVMIGVAIEHSFMKLLEAIEASPKHSATYKNAGEQKTILQRLNKFKNILDQNAKQLPSEIKEDLDTNFTGIFSMIRNFRNESGHPSGKIISREQNYILLQLFIPCCKKIYQMIDYYKSV